MKIDFIAREIRAAADRLGLRWECQTVPVVGGGTRRLWWLSDRVGREPVGFIGGQDDDATLKFLNVN
jgi:hypothetical protein